ncbi:MAG: hypothetical protein HIU89_16935 [Proteobacteria bacterium]|nr:hypothetical protein [Pseudomonadota bacterium]
MRNRITFLMTLAAGLMSTTAIALSPPASPSFHPTPQGMRLELEKAFHTRSPWRLVVTEGVPVKDYGERDAPGALTLCLQRGTGAPCLSGPVTPPLRATTPDDPMAWEPHYLLTARVVYPRGTNAAPLLLLVTGSLNSGDGDQLVYTQLLGYDPSRDEFLRVYCKSTGHNNNQEIRFITDGPLRGSVISAEPQEHSPYGYWIVINTLSHAGAYRQVLRYLSATRYNDHNPLAVIDSEMPNIERRLGLWKLGEPIPTPSAGDSKACIKPTLRHSELWCK